MLEIGCGQGAGLEVLLTQFGPRFVVGLDLDPKQIIRARRRLTSKFPGRVTFVVSSAKELPFPNEYFDAAVDFGVLHHVVQWQQAMAEIRRILKPNGRFFFEEVTRDALNRRLYRTFLKHPTENRFSREEFVAELAHHGVNLLGSTRSILWKDILIGVGQRAASED